MRFIPLTVSSLLVPRLLDDTKTMTRRKPPAELAEAIADYRNERGDQYFQPKFSFGQWWDEDSDKIHPAEWHATDGDQILFHLGQGYRPGDVLWIREEHYAYGEWEPVEGEFTASGNIKWKFYALPSPFEPDIFFPGSEYDGGITIRSNSFREPGYYKRLARFMPKAYARIFLEVTDVRFERLGHISREDAIAEGIETYSPLEGLIFFKNYSEFAQKDFLKDSLYNFDSGNEIQTAEVASFCTLWESLHGPGSWKRSDWVFVVSFKRIPKPENFK